MFDLELTETGDIDCFISPPLASCKVKFHISEFAVQRVQFLSIPRQKIKQSAPAQKISFKYLSDAPYLLRSKNLDDMDESIQAIRLQFMTELQDVTNDIIGTEFYKTRHTIVKDNTGLDRIKTMATEIATSILPDATVSVSFESSEGYFYCQSVSIYVYYDDKLITKFNF